jgi:N-acetylglucosaminyl transferase
LRELRKIEPDTEIRFWVDHAFEKQARTVMGGYDDSIRVDTIVSGKLRRYHHLKWWQQLMKFRTITLPNIIDVVKVSVGFMQCLCKLIAWRPDVVFTKGGYVCLPVGLAAHVLRIPLVIHDSDAHPGLTNRVLARWADAIGTGAPLKFYPYPREISQYVGVPIMEDFVPYSDERRRDVKVKLGFDPTRPLVVVTGGGLGARRINDAVVAMLSQLTKQTNVILITGAQQYSDIRARVPNDTSKVHIHDFISSGLVDMLGAADIVVARAGATTILELAALAKPTILVPNGYLTGGHQLKNAAVYEEKGAVKVIDELQLDDHPEVLVRAIEALLADRAAMARMGAAFLTFAHPHAALDMAEMIVRTAKHK